MYQPHPSTRLQELFRAKPYQGARPWDAGFVFIGLDANYAPDLERTRAFRDVLEYHENGVAFWQRHRVHHPFLLPIYNGAGRPYHRNFARIGFTHCDAARVSFVELLHLPTTGRSRLEVQDLDPGHLQTLNALINEGRPRHVFVSGSVAELMRRSRFFPWLASRVRSRDEGLPVLHKVGPTTVYQHLHFSSWGECQDQKRREAAAIAALITARSVGDALSNASVESQPRAAEQT